MENFKIILFSFGLIFLLAGPPCQAKPRPCQAAKSQNEPLYGTNSTLTINDTGNFCHDVFCEIKNESLSIFPNSATDNSVTYNSTKFDAGISLDFVYPLYYCFMLSLVDSGQLRLWAATLARSVLQIEDSVENLTDVPLVNQFTRTSDEELLDWKERNKVLHCTVFYNGYKERPGVRDYARSDVVRRNLDKEHQLEISGLLVTPRTISFRVKLNGKQLLLWNQEDRSTLPRGSRAHITIVTAKGVQAMVAGLDTLKLGELMAVKTLTVSHNFTLGKVFKHEEDLWYLALDKPKRVSTFFTAFFAKKDPL